MFYKVCDKEMIKCITNYFKALACLFFAYGKEIVHSANKNSSLKSDNNIAIGKSNITFLS